MTLRMSKTATTEGNVFGFESITKYIVEGAVDYESLMKTDIVNINEKIVNDMDVSQMDDDVKFCYYLNAYNILVLYAVVQKLKNDAQFAGNLSNWSKLCFFYCQKRSPYKGHRLTLAKFENGVIRQSFHDPRMHMYLNCASVSCPVLWPEWLTPENKERILTQASTKFVNSRFGVIVNGPNDLCVSMIFSWYANDFDSVVHFIKKYYTGSVHISDDAVLSFQPYDWRLNSLQNADLLSRATGINALGPKLQTAQL